MALTILVAFVLLACFVLSTAVLAAALGRGGHVPRRLMRYLQAVAGDGQVVAEGNKVLALAVFGSLSIGVLAVEVSDLRTSLQTGDRASGLAAASALAVEALWILYLGTRRGAPDPIAIPDGDQSR